MLSCSFLFYSTLSLVLTSGISTTSDGETIYRDDRAAQDGQTVKLGGLISIHSMSIGEQQCGPMLLTEMQSMESMVLAIQMINNDSTLLPNVRLTFEIRDTCISAHYALQESLNFIEDINTVCSSTLVDQEVTQLGISGVVGPAFSFVSAATANFFGLFQVPQISYASTASFLSTSGLPYFFRTIPPDFYQARVLADLVVHFNWTYIIALHSDDVYGRDGIEAFEKELESFNTNTTRRCIAMTITISNQHDYEDAVTKMSQDWLSNASVAVLFGHVVDAEGLLRIIKTRIEDNPKFPLRNITWIGSDSWGDSLSPEFHPMAKGMLSVAPQFDPIQAFDDYFTSLNLEGNPNPWFREFWGKRFNCSLDSLSSHLEDCDANQNISTGYTQYSFVPLVFDAVYAFAHSIQNLINDRCPNADLCSAVLTNGAITGNLLRDYLLNVSFNSPSQKSISFDKNGDVEGAYTILNLQRIPNSDLYTYKRVGTWNLSHSLLFSDSIEWNINDNIPVSICSLSCVNGQISRQVPGHMECCFICESCLSNSITKDNRCSPCRLGYTANANQTKCETNPITFLTWSNPWTIAILLLTCAGIVATIFVIAVFLVHYEHALIKASSRELSAIMLAGIFLCYILPFFYIARPSAAICAIRRFGVGFCFAVSYSALLVKTNHIHRIFNRKTITSAKNVKCLSPLSQILTTFLFTAVQVFIVMIWLVIEPPTTKIILGLSQNELVCGESSYIGISVSLCYNLFLLVLSTYFAFLTRKVPENFNEAKFINVTVYTILVTWLAFVPTYFATVNLGTVFQTGSLAFGIILSASTTLCCLYMSKVIILFSRIYSEPGESRVSNLMATELKAV